MMSDQEHTEWLGWTEPHHSGGSWVLKVSRQTSRPPCSVAASGLESSELLKSFLPNMSPLKLPNLDSEIDKAQIAHSIQFLYYDNFMYVGIR